MSDRVTHLLVQSYGGGVQSVALAILNATGQVQPAATLAIMADPGMEERGTIEHAAGMVPWLAARGVDLVTVRGEEGKPDSLDLYDFAVQRSTPLPVYLARGGMGRRQCTADWKVRAIRRELRRRGAKTATVQLGISWDENHRMHDSPVKWISHNFPLVDRRLTRADCRQIIVDQGLLQPPKSRCQFCPMQTRSSWRVRAAQDPEGFEVCARLEDRIIEREATKGRGPAFLSTMEKPLRVAFPPGQQIMDLGDDDDPEGVCGGYCFT